MESDPGHGVNRAALDYLATSIVQPDPDLEFLAVAHSVDRWEVEAAAGPLRDLLRFRSYLGEWIRAGKPRVEEVSPRTELATTPVHIEEPFRGREDRKVEARKGVVESLVDFLKRARGVYRRATRPRGPEGRNSWTGSAGTKSYPDRDESPE